MLLLFVWCYQHFEITASYISPVYSPKQSRSLLYVYTHRFCHRFPWAHPSLAGAHPLGWRVPALPGGGPGSLNALIHKQKWNYLVFAGFGIYGLAASVAFSWIVLQF